MSNNLKIYHHRLSCIDAIKRYDGDVIGCQYEHFEKFTPIEVVRFWAKLEYYKREGLI